MEVVGAAASVSQLVVYIHSAATHLSHLYNISKSSPVLLRSRLEDLNILLKILDDIHRNHTPSDAEILIPILINMADTAQTLSRWFNQPGTFRKSLILFVRNADIEEAFRLLRQKCNLLIFYFSEQNNRVLNRLESSLNPPSYNTVGLANTMNSPEIEEGLPSKDAVQPKSFNNHAHVSSNGTSAPHGSNAGVATDINRWQQASGSDEARFFAEFFPPRATESSPQMQSEHPEERRQERGQSTTKIVVAGNRLYGTKADLFNNTYRPGHTLCGSYTDNDVFGQHVKVGNEEPYH